MADSFADIWNSTAPSKPTQPDTLGSLLPNNKAPSKKYQQDAFVLLSSPRPSSSAPNSRSLTPSTLGSSSQHRITPALPESQSSGDAFSGLLGGLFLGNANGEAQMTIAERAKEVEKQRLESLRKPIGGPKTQNRGLSAWDGLDALVNSSSNTTPSPPVAGNDFEFGSIGQSATRAISPTPLSQGDDDWLWMSSGSGSGSKAVHLVPEAGGLDSPQEDFDFGTRENALLDDDSNDEDDILGTLSKPVDSISKPKPNNPSDSKFISRYAPSPPLPPSSRKSNGAPSSRPPSPPPHILGQIVEMGFSVQQAKIALSATDTGLDVQAALETLISNGAAASPWSTANHELSPQLPDYPQPRSSNRLMAGHTRGTSYSSERDQDRNGNTHIQDQADKLLTQASEIGLSVFNKASAFWKEGKDRVQKAYVEHAAASGGRTTPGGGRPKWMHEDVINDNGEDEKWRGKDKVPYLDDGRGRRKANAPTGASSTVSPTSSSPPPRAELSKPTKGDLMSDEPIASAYVSPFRRRKPQPQRPPADATPPSSSQQPVRPPSPRRPRPPLVSASPRSISTSISHKSSGTAAYKLGQYSTAESHYTNAISSLPPSHPLVIPLCTNRALARIKIGDYAGAVEDCTAALEILGVHFEPSMKVEKEDGVGVDLSEGWVKAMRRRAEALEGREKWEEAGRDWNTLAGVGWVRSDVKAEAARGAGRCRRMLNVNKDGELVPGQMGPSQMRPKPSSLPRLKRAGPSSTTPSHALENLRNMNNVAEAEEQQRYELKDGVDAKVLAWKSGKETNIRALLGSLDMVLWPELGVGKVGMADLVTNAQVKGKYVRVIAKLHPDKLNIGNTTVEQRMTANSVFGALNEAWNAFVQ